MNHPITQQHFPMGHLEVPQILLQHLQKVAPEILTPKWTAGTCLADLGRFISPTHQHRWDEKFFDRNPAW